MAGNSACASRSTPATRTLRRSLASLQTAISETKSILMFSVSSIGIFEASSNSRIADNAVCNPNDPSSRSLPQANRPHEMPPQARPGAAAHVATRPHRRAERESAGRLGPSPPAARRCEVERGRASDRIIAVRPTLFERRAQKGRVVEVADERRRFRKREEMGVGIFANGNEKVAERKRRVKSSTPRRENPNVSSNPPTTSSASRRS